jgi:hypothetical protein
MPSRPFSLLILQSTGQKVPKSGGFKNEGIPEAPASQLGPAWVEIGWSRPVVEWLLLAPHCRDGMSL